MAILRCMCRLIREFHGTFADHAILTPTPLERSRLNRYSTDVMRSRRRLVGASATALWLYTDS
jgi:hypothetical protein